MVIRRVFPCKEQRGRPRYLSFYHFIGGRQQRGGISRPSSLAAFRLRTSSYGERQDLSLGL